MMERINGKLIMGALKYLESIQEGNSISAIEYYKQLYSDVMIEIITGPITTNSINIKDIEDFVSKVNQEFIESDNFKQISEAIDSINNALKENKASNLYLIEYKLFDNYTVLISVVDRSTEDHIVEWCDNGCILRCSKDGKVASVILIELEPTDDRKRRYIPVFHELAHAIISVEHQAYLGKVIPDITDDEYLVFDEMLIDLISINHLTGMPYGECIKEIKYMGYQNELLSKEVDRICNELLEDFEKESK